MNINAQTPVVDWPIAPPSLAECNGDGPAALLARLEAAADAIDGGAFMDAYDELHDDELSPEDFIRAIGAAFKIGGYVQARELALRGVAQHPTHAEMQKYAYVLGPPKVKAKGLPPHPHIRANNEWMRQNARKYRGQWVAIRNGELLGAAVSLEELAKVLPDRKDVFLGRF